MFFLSGEFVFQKNNYFKFLNFKKNEQLYKTNDNNINEVKNLRMFNISTTGRVLIWKNIFENNKSRWLTGNGPQADRMFNDISHVQKGEMSVAKQSASNALFYVYASSEIAGVFYLFTFIIKF